MLFIEVINSIIIYNKEEIKKNIFIEIFLSWM